MSHDPTWSVVPPKLPLKIPKFEGKIGEDPGEHIMNFHLWCSSNLLNLDSIHLILFQCTLTGPTTKWYIDLPGGTYTTFDELAPTFPNNFQLHVCYDIGTELFSTF